MNEVVKSVSIGNIVNKRRAFFEEAERLLASIEKMDEIAASFVNDRSRTAFRECSHDKWLYVDANVNGGLVTKHGYKDPLDLIRINVDRHIWSFLMDESGMRTFMDAEARKEWDDQLYGEVIPRVTENNVRATFGELYATRGDLFERGVINVYKSLSWDYKTNSPCCFGKKIIMDGVVRPWRNPFDVWPRPDYRRIDELQDLERCLSILDGKPEPDHRFSQTMRWANAVQGARVDDNEWECDLWRMRWFKKGTLHVSFKRGDLVDKMNGIIAKHYPGALPARL